MSDRRGNLLVALVLCACGTKREASPVVASAVHDSVTDAVDDSRSDQVEIAAHLRGHDGAPLVKCEIRLFRKGADAPLVTEVLDEGERFTVDVPRGVYHLSIAAVDHAQVMRTVLADRDIELSGRLGTYARSRPGETIRIVGEYFDASDERIAHGPTSATRRGDRVYRIDLAEKPAEATTLRYQLVADVGDRTYNGPFADAYESDQGGDFWSRVDVRTRDHLDLDLDRLPPAGKPAALSWAGRDASSAAIEDFFAHWQEHLGQLMRRIPRKDGQILEMAEEHRAEARRLAERARTQLEANTDPDTQALMRAAHLSLFTSFVMKEIDTHALAPELSWLVEAVDPADPRLALVDNVDRLLYRVLDQADAELVERIETWLDRRVRENPEPDTALAALEMLIARADRRRDPKRVAELYAAITSDRFEGMFRQSYLKLQYDPDRVMQRGKPFPSFDFPALGSQDRRVTSDERAGRLYLVEFWATWCGPCVAEMPKLHETYAAINGAAPGKGRGDAAMRRLRPVKQPKIEFVFVSLDAAPEAVEAFRRDHWSMPWTHAFVGRDREEEVMQRFGFAGVPMVVLIDERGTILETEHDLRDDALLPTLQRVLAERVTGGATSSSAP